MPPARHPHATQQVHWCWVGGKQRVKRLGRADECVHCRRSEHRHKCGMVPVHADAWRDYPVTDCAACMAERGGIAEEPQMRLLPPRVPARAVRQQEPTRKDTRIQKMQNKRRRKMALLLACTCGCMYLPEFVAVLESFGATVHRRLVSTYLEELVNERWLERTKVERERTNKHQLVRWQWEYTVNIHLQDKVKEVLRDI